MELGLRNMEDTTLDQLRCSLKNAAKVLRTSINPARRSIGAFTTSTLTSIKSKRKSLKVQDDDYSDDDGWSDNEFSDFESDEETAGPQNVGNYDLTACQDVYNDACADENYENFDSVLKTDEMRKAPPSLPPRKTDFSPKPPARRKKEKKPTLPEKIHTDQEDNQFYEEMSQMTLKSSVPSLPPAKNMPPPPTKSQQNKTSLRVEVDESDYIVPIDRRSSQDQDDDPPSIPAFKLPPRKMPAIPPATSNDTPPNKTSMLHSSVSSRPRIDPPKEKPPENPLNALRWYHGDSERVVVEKKLLQFKKDGMFAVRNSKTKGPNYPYAVTLYHGVKTYNFPIRIRDSDKRLALGTEKQNEPSFETLENLIDYFKTNNIKLVNNQSALLNIPLDRSS